MSVKVENNIVHMTRGDTLKVRVDPILVSDEGVETPYVPVPGDVIRFALKTPRMTYGDKQFKDPEPLIIKNIPIDTLILRLDPLDTKGFDFGQYVYDIQLTDSNGEVDTFITETAFYIEPEVD